MEHRRVPIQSLIDHIKTSVDVDPWAMDMAEELLKRQEPVDMELEGGGSTWWHVCGECHGTVDDSDKFCRHCGRPFKKDMGGCDGCEHKGGEDCPLTLGKDGNYYNLSYGTNFACLNGKLRN